MSEKITLQALAESFSKKNNLSKKNADAFIKGVFDSIVDGLLADGVVKVKGLGTFRCIDVDERESVSVSTGERVLIPGYRKVNFVADDILISYIDDSNTDDLSLSADRVKDPVECSHVDKQSYVEEQNTEVSALDALLQEDVNAPECVEVKSDDFSGIDLLICTPESIDGVKEDLWKARNVAVTLRSKAEQAICQAKDAEQEVLRLEKLLLNLENQRPYNVVERKSSEPVTEGNVEEDVSSLSNNACAIENEEGGVSVFALSEGVSMSDLSVVPEEQGQELSDDKVDELAKSSSSCGNRKLLIVLLSSLLLLCLFGGTYYWCFLKNGEEIDDNGVEDCNMPISKPTNDNEAFVPVDSLASVDTVDVDTVEVEKFVGAISPDSIVVNEMTTIKTDTVTADIKKQTQGEDEMNSIKPDKHILREGETLMMLARRFYGSSDSVTIIINANKFPNPDNVHVGTVVILP